MVTIKNHIPCLLKSFCIMFLMVFSPVAFANDPIFTIENVKVDVTAENAITARAQAFEEAQIKAFTMLSTRMLPAPALATTQTPPVNVISTMVRDFEITNEQLSSVRYVGTYIFRFKGSDVRRYFSRRGETVTDVSSKKLLILPFINRDNRTSIWTPGNPWMQAWNRVQSLNGLVPMDVPLGDLSDVQDISDNGAFSYQPNRLQSMLRRYGAHEAVVTIATPDEMLGQIIDPLATAKGTLTIEVYRTDRGQAELVDQISINADGVQTRRQIYDRAVTLVRSALQKDWKAKIAIDPTPITNKVRAVVPIESLNEWLNIQSNLNRISSFSDITLKALTPSQANIEILYKGSEQRLALSLAQAGLEIERTTASDGSPLNVLISSHRQSTRF